MGGKWKQSSSSRPPSSSVGSPPARPVAWEGLGGSCMPAQSPCDRLPPTLRKRGVRGGGMRWDSRWERRDPGWRGFGLEEEEKARDGGARDLCDADGGRRTIRVVDILWRGCAAGVLADVEDAVARLGDCGRCRLHKRPRSPSVCGRWRRWRRRRVAAVAATLQATSESPKGGLGA